MEYKDVPHLVREFLMYMKTIKNRSKATMREYYYDLRHTFRFIYAMKNNLDIYDIDKLDISKLELSFFKDITLMDLYEYLNFLSDNKEDKSATRARKVAALKSFFNYLCLKAKVLDVNPAVELETPKLDVRIPKYLNLDESKTLLNVIDGKHRERDYAIITLFLNCGLRLSELVNINFSNIKGDTLSIIGKGNKERSIYLNKACKEAINDYMYARSQLTNIKDKDALFLSNRGTRISPRMVEIMVKNNLELAGLDTKKYSPHKLRHTAATLMHKHGNVDIRALQQILGHESISTTQIYTHIDNEQVKVALESNPLNNI